MLSINYLTKNMKLSIIIPTYNERRVLVKAIESLGEQTFTDFEIIVVDDGSTDGTKEILNNLSNTLKDFKYYLEEHKGAGAARNLGASYAKGDILVFVDADMTFDKYFVEKLTDPILKNISKGTFSKEEYVENWDNIWSRCWNINEGWEDKKRHPKNFPDHEPVFRAILKSEFEKVGGFTPGGYNDDWSLSQKLGYQAVAAPGAVFYHKNPGTLKETFEQAKWVGKRKYKFGIIGYFAALIRTSLPISLVVGSWKAIKNKEAAFLIFKIVYDLGIFFGVLDYMIFKRGEK